jgi:hemerythrin
LDVLHWTPDLNLGIEIIDGQHRRIVEYHNRLHEARTRGDRKVVAEVLDGLVDYTQSHFSFEEAVMAAAGFRLAATHRSRHEQFVHRLGEYLHRFALGEDIAGEVQETVKLWLLNHIKREDREYAVSVRNNLDTARLQQILRDDETARAMVVQGRS